jgi:hypothetical protein
MPVRSEKSGPDRLVLKINLGGKSRQAPNGCIVWMRGSVLPSTRSTYKFITAHILSRAAEGPAL